MKKILIFVLVMSVLLSFGKEGWLRFYRLRLFENSLQEKNRLLQESNLVLMKEITDLKDPKYVVHYIRDTMGFVTDDEIIFEKDTSVAP